MTSKKKIGTRVIAIAVSLCVVGASAYLGKVLHYQITVKNLTYSDISIGEITDGTYIGECDVDFIYAKVAVTVENGVMTQIEILEHKNDRGASAEKITEDIVRQQSVDVETVSGATNSSKVIKKAVEQALTEQVQSITGHGIQGVKGAVPYRTLRKFLDKRAGMRYDSLLSVTLLL